MQHEGMSNKVQTVENAAEPRTWFLLQMIQRERRKVRDPLTLHQGLRSKKDEKLKKELSLNSYGAWTTFGS